MAFQFLAYAAENITGTPFPELVISQLIKPLNLTRTYLTNPGSAFPNSVIIDGWDLDFGDEAPMGGYAMASLGRPWEILRRDVPVSPGSRTTRVVDLYTRQGGGTAYTSLIALSPDYGVGLSLLTAGPVPEDFHVIKKSWSDAFLPALEEASREQASVNFVGKYVLSDNSTATVGLLSDEPGLFLSEMHSENTDFLALIGTVLTALSGKAPEKGFGAFLYPTGLVEKNRVAFRAIYSAPGKTVLEDCGSWAEEDRIRYGGYPGDLFIFHLGENGMATGLEVPVADRTMLRA
ncbi:hypothetical protein B0H67DRAFT_551187 [Lasiosphaeris hirsuta]|uniref:Beta-lactamase-like ARB-00930-like C-terminal domain-containing protein n=1 Tax=Lasiosphaeris hirsuta TaxID=260670 RepID=A0AA40B1A0_9PEZI|nr:hypothetical protein B0H67DRAFT_551187 [Lasiosphaeris hirsuta]